MSTVAEQLRAARALIADPAHWCQGQSARYGNGWPCSPNDPRARRWCAIGALDCVAGGTWSAWSAVSALDAAAEDTYADDLQAAADVNDRLGHAAVLALYDAAIAAAEAEVRP